MISSPHLFETGVDLAENTRTKVIEMLNQQLADGFDLYSHAKQAHWNVKGKNFFQLHELFDELAGALLEKLDVVAERVTALGGLAEGTVHMSASASRLPQFPGDIYEEDRILDTLIQHYTAYATSTRAAIDSTMELGDEGTADLFIELSRMIDKHLWFLEAHHQA